MRKSRLLLISSALMMLSSLTRIFFGIGMLNYFVSIRSFGTIDPRIIRYAGCAMVCHIVCAAAELVGGFHGAINWEEPLLTGRCLRWGVIALAAGLLGNICQQISGYGISYVAWTTGAAVPALYLLAAVIFRIWGKRML